MHVAPKILPAPTIDRLRGLPSGGPTLERYRAAAAIARQTSGTIEAVRATFVSYQPIVMPPPPRKSDTESIGMRVGLGVAAASYLPLAYLAGNAFGANPGWLAGAFLATAPTAILSIMAGVHTFFRLEARHELTMKARATERRALEEKRPQPRAVTANDLAPLVTLAREAQKAGTAQTVHNQLHAFATYVLHRYEGTPRFNVADDAYNLLNAWRASGRWYADEAAMLGWLTGELASKTLSADDFCREVWHSICGLRGHPDCDAIAADFTTTLKEHIKRERGSPRSELRRALAIVEARGMIGWQ